MVTRLRGGQAQGHLASFVCQVACRAGRLVAPGAFAENDIKPGAHDVWVRLSCEPVPARVWDDTALPRGGLGPVERQPPLMCAPRSLCRRRDNLNWPRPLQLAVLSRHQPHALLQVGPGALVALVLPVAEYLPTQHQPRVNPERYRSQLRV